MEFSQSAGLEPVAACPICDGKRRRLVGRRGDRPIPELMRSGSLGLETSVFACRSCRHVYVDPVPSAELLATLYAKEAADYFAHLEGAGGSGVVRLLSRWSPRTGRLLDVGCGGGRLMREARDAGWQVSGIEPTPDFARRADSFGAVHVGYLDAEYMQAHEASGYQGFDVVTMMAVLEHVADAVDVLEHARSVAASGALLVAEVPNAHRPEAVLLDLALRARGVPWTVRTAPLQSPFHLAEFSRQSMAHALKRAGWNPLEITVTEGRNPYPVPAIAGRLIRGLEIAGGWVGKGLNMTAVARA